MSSSASATAPRRERREHEARWRDQELHDAALQFVRKISGYTAPSRASERTFETAVNDVAAAGRALFESLPVGARVRSTA